MSLVLSAPEGQTFELDLGPRTVAAGREGVTPGRASNEDVMEREKVGAPIFPKGNCTLEVAA
jgi:hypothetical protein